MDKKVRQLLFHHEFDERAEWEAEQRGLCDYVSVELDNGMRYRVCFYIPSRLAVSINALRDGGEPDIIGIPGLIVISQVTVEKMKQAASVLAEDSYFFEGLVPEDCGGSGFLDVSATFVV